MKRMLIIAVAGAALLATLPASALAGHRHHRRHHSRHHARVRHFGHETGTSTTTTSGSTATAGTVAAFDGTTLTIKLNDNSMVSGKVTPGTEIECSSTPASATTLHEDGDGGGDHSGGGDDNAGSDDHGDNNDQGDNNGDQDEAGQASCSGALTQGATVQEAELSVSGSGAVWKKVELAG